MKAVAVPAPALTDVIPIVPVEMMKRKLGPKLRTEKEVSQRNEILLKCLVHNIIVLIHVLHESPLRIDFDFCADRVFAQK